MWQQYKERKILGNDSLLTEAICQLQLLNFFPHMFNQNMSCHVNSFPFSIWLQLQSCSLVMKSFSFRPRNLIVPVTNKSFYRSTLCTMPNSCVILSTYSLSILLIFCLSPKTGLSSTISQGKVHTKKLIKQCLMLIFTQEQLSNICKKCWKQ